MAIKRPQKTTLQHDIGIFFAFLFLVGASISYWVIFSGFISEKQVLGKSIAQLQPAPGEDEPEPTSSSPSRLSGGEPTSTPEPTARLTSPPQPTSVPQPTSIPPPPPTEPNEPPRITIYPNPPVIPIEITPPPGNIPDSGPGGQPQPPGQTQPIQEPSNPFFGLPFFRTQPKPTPANPPSSQQPRQRSSMEPIYARSTDTGQIVNLLNNPYLTFGIGLQNGQFELTAGDTIGLQYEIDTSIYPLIADLLDAEGIRLYRTDTSFIIQRGNVGVETEYRLSFDIIKRDIVVHAPTGRYNLEILPDRTLEYIRDTDALDEAQGNSTNIASITHLGRLFDFDGELAYEFIGSSCEHFLLVWPVCLRTTVVTAAGENRIIGVHKSPFRRVIHLLSL